MSEFFWVFDSLDQFGSVFDVSPEVPYLRVKYVFQTVFPHEMVGQYSDALLNFVVQVLTAPHFP